MPHAEHVACVSTRSRENPSLRPPPGLDMVLVALLALHYLQRFGSFLNCLSAKKSCSPAVQMNSLPQSTHLRDLSWNSIGRHLVSSFVLWFCYSNSRRSFLRLRLRARACLALRLSPGFR